MILRMATGSMRPTVREGDYLLAEPGGTPRPGEVWVMPPGPGRPDLWAHRVARADGATLVLRGDACAEDDAPVPASAALARVTAVGRELGRAPHPLASALAGAATPWLLSGRAASFQAALGRGAKRLEETPGTLARWARRALLETELAHEELLCGVRARGLLAVSASAVR